MLRNSGRRLSFGAVVVSKDDNIPAVRADLTDHDAAKPLDPPIHLARLHQNMSSS